MGGNMSKSKSEIEIVSNSNSKKRKRDLDLLEDFKEFMNSIPYVDDDDYWLLLDFIRMKKERKKKLKKLPPEQIMTKDKYKRLQKKYNSMQRLEHTKYT